jgi:pimeloyl-ACP methyl ester carboxylesterase
MQYVVESDLTERVLGRDTGRDDLGTSYRVVRWGFGRRPSPAQVLFVRDSIASVRPDVRAETYRIMTGHDLTPMLPTVQMPAMVMIGDRDHLVNPRESLAMARGLPRANVVRYPDAGHAMFLEEHDAFNADLKRFAERRLRGGKQGGKRSA